jgi:hypothetical protein
VRFKFHQHFTESRACRQSARFYPGTRRDTLRNADPRPPRKLCAPGCIPKMLSLKEAVDRYSTLAKQWGDPVALDAFGLDREETIKLFTSLDEDYHISRFVNFSLDHGRLYLISGNPSTHIRVDEAIRSLL